MRSCWFFYFCEVHEPNLSSIKEDGGLIENMSSHDVGHEPTDRSSSTGGFVSGASYLLTKAQLGVNHQSKVFRSRYGLNFLISNLHWDNRLDTLLVRTTTSVLLSASDKLWSHITC